MPSEIGPCFLPSKTYIALPRFVSLWNIAGLLGVLLLVPFLASCGGGGGTSSGTASSPTVFSLSVTPGSLTIVPNSTVTLTVTAGNTSATPSVTFGQLPSGLSTTTSSPVAIPANGATVTIQADSTVAPGKYTLTLNGQAGSATTSVSVPITVSTTTTQPSFYFTGQPFRQVAAPIGGSGQVQFTTASNGQATYNVALSVSGLPAGTTATISPSTIIPGQSITVSITASSTALISQNVNVTLTGSPSAPVPQASINFLVSVSNKPGALPNNRTDYLSTEGTPYSAVYDPSHKLIFSSNPSWNRVDVISSTTHAIVKSIPIRDPHGVDITQDNSRVWITTGSQQLFEINTGTLTVRRYLLPQFAPSNYVGPQSWEGLKAFALADGTIMLLFSHATGDGSYYLAIWNPSSNTLSGLLPPRSLGSVHRTGDGKRVYAISSDSSGESFYYDVLAKSFSGVIKLGGYALASAVNFDGSRVAVYDAAGLNLYDGNLDLIGPLPGGGVLGEILFEGGMVFSTDKRYLYEISMPTSIPVIWTIDANTLGVVSVAPAMAMIPVLAQLSPPFFMADPFAVDDTGMVLGIQDYGIAFDDATFAQKFVTAQPGTPTFLQHMVPYAGPLGGGTTSGGFGNAFSMTPDVWYGANRGTARVDSNGILTITSPPGNTTGPVNVKMLFPDGREVFDPLFFSYGPTIEHAVQSGASPSGGATAQITGYGLPANGSGGTVFTGGAAAAITSSGRIPVPSGYPFPASIVNFTAPPGSPGWADITVNTPNGQAKLPKGMYYAQSVTDYSSADTFTAVLYDGKRQQLYLSAGDHIDVFSLSSSRFLSPLTPPARGVTKQFAGLALTPDSSLLLATDLLDGSLAVINPDSPTSSYVISVAAINTSDPRCTRGPLYVASLVNNQAVVVTGGLPATGCGPGGVGYQVDLTSRASTQLTGSCFDGQLGTASYVSSSHDGTKVAFSGGTSFCTYDATKQTYKGSGLYQRYGSAISADGNVAASQWVFTDSTANVIGRVARPDVYFGAYYQGNPPTFYLLQEPKLNDAGSLYYMAYPNFFDIVDVQHGILRMRFSVTETISNTAVPIAIDSGGRHVYMITNQGLTIVDLGQAPLSIGSLSPSSALPGTLITVRGSGFTSSTTATVGGQSVNANFIDENTLTFTVPSIISGPANVVLKNSDGTIYTLESGVTIP